MTGRPRPVRQSVRSRWYLPPKTQHVSIPYPVLEHVFMRLGGEELRVALWLVGDWWWPGGLEREVNSTIIARRCRMRRSNVSRALESLARRNVIELRSGGKGRPATVSIAPLVDLGRHLASEVDSIRYTEDGKFEPAGKKTQYDTTMTQVDTPSSIKREPGVPTSESFSSEYVRPARQARGTTLSFGGSNGEQRRGGPPRQIAAELKRQADLAILADIERQEASSARAAELQRKLNEAQG